MNFATKLFQNVGAEPGNLFLSPFSIHGALAMTSVGAKGETRKVLTELLNLSESLDVQNEAYAAYLEAFKAEGDAYELVNSNALWGQQGYSFKEEFKSAIAKYYQGKLTDVDYEQPGKAVSVINRWVSDATHGKIPTLITADFISPVTRLILTNAIYFKGIWETPFLKEKTKEEEFYTYGAIAKTPMMHKKDNVGYYEDATCQAIDLPYQGDTLSMLVVLPVDGVKTVAEQDGLYNNIITSLRREDVIISLPKFKMESSFSLKAALQKMGAGSLFTEEADFSGMAKESLHISDVVHKSFVDCDEQGTEAAAATAVGMVGRGFSRPKPPKVFEADHPFMFYIRNCVNNVILFTGRLVKP